MSALQNSYNYDAFGNSTDLVTSQTYNPFEYCGEYVDGETGFLYLRNRYYDPSIGRFITEDPAKDGLNWYVYCNSDPVNYIDPLGLEGKRYYIVVFAGINTNIGNFEHVGKNIEKHLLDENSDNMVNYITIYPYDNSISGDAVDDTIQVGRNAYELSGNSVTYMADQVKEGYNGEDYIHFVGYSGGGVAASKTAEKLEQNGWKPSVSTVVRLGSPKLYVRWNWWSKRTVDIACPGDAISLIKMPRGFLNISAPRKTINGLKYDILNPADAHMSYFRQGERYADKGGVENITKTTSLIVRSFK